MSIKNWSVNNGKSNFQKVKLSCITLTDTVGGEAGKWFHTNDNMYSTTLHLEAFITTT